MANFLELYIDIRVDFNSWIPSLDKIFEKLLNFYINKFIRNKILHDKVEFEILLLVTPSTSKRIDNILKKISLKMRKTYIKRLKKINFYQLKISN